MAGSNFVQLGQFSTTSVVNEFEQNLHTIRSRQFPKTLTSVPDPKPGFGSHDVWDPKNEVVKEENELFNIKGGSFLALFSLLGLDSKAEDEVAEISPIVAHFVPMITFTVACACLALAIAGAVAYMKRLFYAPSKQIEWTPLQYQMDLSEDVFIRTQDGVSIHCWLIKSKNSNKVPTILFFHGWEGNISHRLGHVVRLREMDVNILLVSYRGYGKSEGSPSEEGLTLDAQAALDYLLGRIDIDPRKIVILGTSLGGAVSINLLTRNPHSVAGLILENTFTSLEEMIIRHHPFFCYLLFLGQDKWQSDSKVSKLQLPIFFISGAADSFVPPLMMTALYDKAKESPKTQLVKIENGDNHDTYMQTGYAKHIEDFITEILAEVEPVR